MHGCSAWAAMSDYLKKHGVPAVLDDVWKDLLADRPADPLGYMADKVSSGGSW